MHPSRNSFFPLFLNLNDIPEVLSGKALSRADESATNEKNEYPSSLLLAQLVNGRQGSYLSDVAGKSFKDFVSRSNALL